eukprot:1358527-Rhodomonas_salina.5
MPEKLDHVDTLLVGELLNVEVDCRSVTIAEDDEHLEGCCRRAQDEELADAAAGARTHLIALVDSESSHLDSLERRGHVRQHVVETRAQRVLQLNERHAGLGLRQLHLHLEEPNLVRGYVEGPGHHRLRSRGEVHRGGAHAGAVVGHGVRGRLEQHAAAASVPVLVERDERE